MQKSYRNTIYTKRSGVRSVLPAFITIKPHANSLIVIYFAMGFILPCVLFLLHLQSRKTTVAKTITTRISNTGRITGLEPNKSQIAFYTKALCFFNIPYLYLLLLCLSSKLFDRRFTPYAIIILLTFPPYTILFMCRCVCVLVHEWTQATVPTPR